MIHTFVLVSAELTAKLRRSRQTHVPGLYLITSICGVIDAACFLALGGVLAELMTGNLLFLAVSFGAREIDWMQIYRYAEAVVAFIAGAIVGGRILRGPAFLRERRRGFIFEWAIVVLATVLAFILQPGETGVPREIVITLLAFAMGIQNALIREHGVPMLATNVMTLTLTGLFADKRKDPHGWRRPAASILMFVVSGAVGAAITVQLGVEWALLLAALVFTVALYWLIPPERAIAGEEAQTSA